MPRALSKDPNNFLNIDITTRSLASQPVDTAINVKSDLACVNRGFEICRILLEEE